MMQWRGIKRGAARASVLLLLPFLLLLGRNTPRRPHRAPDYAVFWTRSLPLQEGRYPGKYLPFVVFPVEQERLAGSNVLEETSSLTTFTSHQVVLVPSHTRPAPPTYLHRSLSEKAQPEPQEIIALPSPKPRLSSVSEFYRYLRTPQTKCRKLARLGGVYCRGGQDYGTHQDGHKYVCLDAVFELSGASHPTQCLSLSFGTQMETSFDDALAVLPCEVHMFDVLDYDPALAREMEHVHFHPEGLSDRRRAEYHVLLNVTFQYDTFKSHVAKNGLFLRPIHVLKVDVENGEWEAFRNIARDPLFDAVGQVALEVHTTDLVYPTVKSRHRMLETLQERYEVLKMIEARGFRRVMYWDNPLGRHRLEDEAGTRQATVGEMLYINRNWYNVTFKQQLADVGFKFRR